MFMWYLGGGIGHRATHQASPAVSSEELVDKTVDWEESDGGNWKKEGVDLKMVMLNLRE